jgi:16S rRNA (cytidine1402-2'-O)-methyltransferase
MSTLYIVATPIGNLEDVTLRALRVLGEADLILCEDTRVTKRLLVRHSIATPTMSYHARSGAGKAGRILDLLAEGKNLALVTDAGTPGISDPGSELVRAVRERFGSEITVVPIPGPNAAAAALSASGLPSSDFLFLGFLPHKKGRETLFREIAASERTVVLYESPHRILKTLQSLTVHLAPERMVVAARELTKIHEEFVSGTPAEVLAHFTVNAERVRGEFVVIISGA